MVSVDEAPVVQQASPVDILGLDEALRELASFDDRSCRIIELRYFTGLNISETAEALEISTATVEREWALGKAWLLKRLSPQP
jgi:DNA-directed RNA polymerase specialized sigma subunit